MTRRWIVLTPDIVALVALANVIVLIFWAPRVAKSATANSPPGNVPVANAIPAAAISPTRATTAATSQPGAAVTSSSTVASAHGPRPTPPPVQPGFHVEREVFTGSGNLSVEYQRDRARGVRQIVLQDAHDKDNSTVLVQYKRNSWVLTSPDEEWIVVNSRELGAEGAQLYHRVSKSPLKYEVPETLRADGPELQDVIWREYTNELPQGAKPDRRRVTIDATGWDADSHKISLAVTPMATKDGTEPPPPWTCTYDVTTSQIETVPEVAEGPSDQQENDQAADMGDASSTAPAESEAEAANGDAAPGDGSADLEGEKFPATRQEPITIADANELSLPDVRYAINEMFARHGANFQDAKIKKTFAQFSWYQPQPGVSFDDLEKQFSEVEKHNVDVLRRCRDAKLAAARRKSTRPIRGQPVDEETEGQRFLRGVLQGVSDGLQNP